MKILCKIGDFKTFSKVVIESETAAFKDKEVHPFYGKFALAKDAEWSSRQFVIEMIEHDEEGIGTFVNINHISPALVGEKVDFTAKLIEIRNHKIKCKLIAKVYDRVIAEGETDQKILKKIKVDRLERNLKEANGKEKAKRK